MSENRANGYQPFRFTSFLRQQNKKLRNTNSTTSQEVILEMRKRNAWVEKNRQAEVNGTLLSIFDFEEEAELLERCRYSQIVPARKLYVSLREMVYDQGFFEIQKVKEEYNIAKIYRITLESLDLIEGDYKQKSSINRMAHDKIIEIIQNKIPNDDKVYLQTVCKKIFEKQDDIKNYAADMPSLFGDLNYNDTVFDDLFTFNPYQHLDKYLQVDSSDEEEQLLNEIKEEREKGNQIEYIEEQPQQIQCLQVEEESSEEEALEMYDAENGDPSRINWIKFIFDTKMPKNDLFCNPDFLYNLINMIRSRKTDDEITEDLLDLIGYDNIEAMSELMQKREYIITYCQQLQEELDKERNAMTDLGEQHQHSKQVTVTYVQAKKKKGGKRKNFEQSTQERQSNYALLERLGFDQIFIDEQRRLGLKPMELSTQNIPMEYMIAESYQVQRKQDQVFERPKDDKFTTKQVDGPDWKQIFIEPPEKPDRKAKLIEIIKLPEWSQQAFRLTKQLNEIQSKVFKIAFKSSKNMLVAAPTGAGKTNIALLTILREVSNHSPEISNDMSTSQFKIIYIAPLKALAAEIVGKFSLMLKYMNIKVRELTGDMNLSKQEIHETHILVTTPEKWDVVTRKTDGMMDMVNVMIIDEIHLLNDGRGLVLECLVARALRTSVKNQRPVRLVGLSATLPNYKDVAQFLHADGDSTFYFDPSYRPTPLKCGFYGVRHFGNTVRMNQIMNEIVFQNLIRVLEMGKQAIVFVHKRADTIRTAQDIIELIKENPQHAYLFEAENSHKKQKEVDRSRNKNVKELYREGFGIHNAGMLRKDRTMTEALFEGGYMKVLCSTSTLAWGINLPAYQVIIKGTKVYDSSKGEYKDIGVFDVQQIFGRAGRPQYDSQGEGIIITTIKNVDEYVKMMSNQQHIESNLLARLDDCLNAEIAIGTVTTVQEGMQWLQFTYLSQRMGKNPNHYGRNFQEFANDPSCISIFNDIIHKTGLQLHNQRLIRYNVSTGQFSSTDIGRIASNYYINCKSMEKFANQLKDTMDLDMILYQMANSSEFEQLDPRPEEQAELLYLSRNIVLSNQSESEAFSNYGKVLVLFEHYLKGSELQTFSLIADTSYIVQNGARILRAIFEIALNQNQCHLAIEALELCKILDKRLLPDQTPLRQFTQFCNLGKLTNQSDKIPTSGYLSSPICTKIENCKKSLSDLYDRDDHDLGHKMTQMEKDEYKKFLRFLPRFSLDVQAKPLTRTILKIQLTLFPDFEWNDRWNRTQESFWIIVDNDEEILYSEHYSLNKKDASKIHNKLMHRKINQKQQEDDITLTFFVPFDIEEGAVRARESQYYNIRVISDRWVGVQSYYTLELNDINVPEEDYPHTKLLDLQPLPISVLNNEYYENLYREKFSYFNPIQTQVFHCLYHTDVNSLIGAPTGSGKTIMAELAMLRVFNKKPNEKIIYIAPLKALAKERILDWKARLQESELNKKVLELTGDVTPDLKALMSADVLITTPEKWDGISRNWQHRNYVQQVALIIIDEIHLLGQERGPVLEVIVSRMRFISDSTGSSIRIVGLSTALANAKDVADWLGINKIGLFNFKPSVRPVPVKIFIQGFPEKHYCPRMATMNRPAYKAIFEHSPNNPVLIFVSSRRQTRLTALDLIAQCASENDLERKFLHMPEEEVENYCSFIKDENLRHTMQYGIGMHHAGLQENDRKIVEELFVNRKIQILVTTSTLAWGVNFPARLVIVKGTEFFDPKVKRYVEMPVTDILQMIGRAGRPQYDEEAFAVLFVQEEKKNFYKKFLYEPFPVESSLVPVLADHLNAEIAGGSLNNRNHCIDYLTWTYFFRRLTKNPTFYDLHQLTPEAINKFLSQIVSQCLQKLKDSKCIEYDYDEGLTKSTPLGYLASFYYLSHETAKSLHNSLKGGQHIDSLIEIMSNAKEFSGLPVRHNEDILNEALSKLVPHKVPRHDFDSPHVKANLLLQAHFSQSPMPITDYITDMKSVLDQSIRVLQAMIEISASKGILDTTLMLIHLQQMVIQGLWLNDSPLRNIPHFNTKIINRLAELQITSLPQLILHLGNIKNFFKDIVKIKIDIDAIHDIYHALNRIPRLSMKYAIRKINDDVKEINEELEDEGEIMMHVQIQKENFKVPQKMMIMNFPKAKEPAWFIIIGNEATNEVISMTRCMVKHFSQKKLHILLPKDINTNYRLQIYLMCDSYIGIDQMYHINLWKVDEQIKESIEREGKTPSPEIKKWYSFEFGEQRDIEHENQLKEELIEHDSEFTDQEGSEDDSEISDGMIEKDLDNWF